LDGAFDFVTDLVLALLFLATALVFFAGALDFFSGGLCTKLELYTTQSTELNCTQQYLLCRLGGFL